MLQRRDLVKKFEIIHRYEEGAGSGAPLPRNATEARLRLEEGNRAFASLFDSPAVDGHVTKSIVPIDLSRIRDADGATEQRPFAAVLGCADARVPTELIFNMGPNDVFVMRVAGNGLGSDVLGSVRYAVEHLGKSLKLIAVLGHSGCGAVSSAVDVFLNPSGYLALATNRTIRGILDQLGMAVHASARKLQDTFGGDVASRPGYRSALIEMAVVTNAAFTAHSLQRAIRDEEITEIQATYGVYLLESGRIWAPKVGSADWSGLADAPADLADFAKFGEALSNSSRILHILESRR